MFSSTLSRAVLASVVAATILPLAGPSAVHACACGCGVFEVGTASMYPTNTGRALSLEYDFMNQDGNWSGSVSAPAAANADKQIRTSFVTAGVQVMATRAWGATVELPYWNRYFRTTNDAGDVTAATHESAGDARVRGIYTGFSPDMSTGVTAGLKLPTGDHRYPGFDRDTEIGTGSTDLLLGAWHVAPLTADRSWDWFADGQWSRPFAYAGDYRPGAEADLTAGVSHARLRVGGAAFSPLIEVIGALRARDRGALANPGDSGYVRLLVAPGLDAGFAGGRATLLADVAVFEHVNGDQLVAPVLFKLAVAHPF